MLDKEDSESVPYEQFNALLEKTQQLEAELQAERALNRKLTERLLLSSRSDCA